MATANNGNKTHIAPCDRRTSAPDISNHSTGMCASSPHLPILYNLRLLTAEGERMRTIPKKTTYSFTKADWAQYNRRGRELLAKHDKKGGGGDDPHKRCKILTECLRKAGDAIPRVVEQIQWLGGTVISTQQS